MDVFGEGGNIKKSETLVNDFNNHPIIKNDLIIASFLILAILSEFLIIKAHFMIGAQDLQFHWNEFMELKESIKAGNWLPQFATNQFNGIGSAIMTFYPYLLLLPVALLSFIVKSNLALIFTTFAIATVLSMMIAFYSSLSVSHKVSTSYLFAAIYGTSVTHVGYFFDSFDLGTFLTLVVLPLAVFGFMHFIKDGHWMEMSLGVILIIFSHVLNSIFIIVFLAIWTLINLKKLNKQKVVNLIKSIVVIVSVTCIFWLPALNIYLNNNIQKPATFPLGGTSLPDIFTSVLSNDLGFYLNIFDIIAGLIFPFIFYKHFSRNIKQVYWIAMVVFIMCTKIFPWSLFSGPFRIIQFPWRLFIFAEILLDYVFAVCVTKYAKTYRLRKGLFYISMIVIIILSTEAPSQIVKEYSPYPSMTTNKSLNIPYSLNPVHPMYKLSKSSQFNNIAHNDTNNDYYPQIITKNKSLQNQLYNTQGLYNVNKQLQFDYAKNGKFTFNNDSGNNIQELNLPFFDYNGENYKVYLDHHIIPSHANKTQLLTINNVKQGNHTLKIIPTVTALTRASRIISIIGILLYLFFALSRLFKRIKITRRKKKIKAVE